MAAADYNREFEPLAPAGHYVALRVGFAFPTAEYNALPPAWVAEYTRAGLMLFDPVVRWVYGNVGSVRWSEIGGNDPRGVFAMAAAHGLNYGVAIACDDASSHGQRSFGSFARSDREFTDEEIARLAAMLQRLHDAMSPPRNLTDAELEALGMVKAGLRLKQIAGQLGISEGAVKQRLRNAKQKLGANTASQAVSLAAGYGLI